MMACWENRMERRTHLKGHSRVLAFILVLMIAASCILALSYPSFGGEAVFPPACQSQGFPRWTFEESHLFPPDRMLARPEDGKALPDGRLVVADETHGLLLLEEDGTHRPFGRLKKVGYIHDPPNMEGGAHGVFLEHEGDHLLLSDVYSGKIYRVNTQTEETRLIYDHPYGVNSLYRDHKGTIWFTQSAHNTEKGGKQSLWASVNLPEPTGGIFSLHASGDGMVMEAKEIVGELYFANGITLDHTEEYMFVAEMNMDRVLRFRVDVKAGTISGRESYQNILMPDNLALDADNNLWIASNMGNLVAVVDRKCRSMHTLFHAMSETNSMVSNEWVKRTHLGQPRGDLLTQGAWNPLPNYLTGVFFSHNYQTVYFTGLGNAILQYAMPRK